LEQGNKAKQKSFYKIKNVGRSGEERCEMLLPHVSSRQANATGGTLGAFGGLKRNAAAECACERGERGMTNKNNFSSQITKCSSKEERKIKEESQESK
jgi:hypothetical protein